MAAGICAFLQAAFLSKEIIMYLCTAVKKQRIWK
jgi:hypothetical protein